MVGKNFITRRPENSYQNQNLTLNFLSVHLIRLKKMVQRKARTESLCIVPC